MLPVELPEILDNLEEAVLTRLPANYMFMKAVSAPGLKMGISDYHKSNRFVLLPPTKPIAKMAPTSDKEA